MMMAKGRGNSQQDRDPEGRGDDHGHRHGDGNGHEGEPAPDRVLLDDEELAAQFEALVAAAQAKGFSQQELGFGLLSATVESLLDNGEAECCVMQLLMDFMASYYEDWHNDMSDDAESFAGEDPENN
jgi:hypothetical protein